MVCHCERLGLATVFRSSSQPHAWPITLVKAIPAWGTQSELLDEAMRQGPAQVVSTLRQDVARMKGFWGKIVIHDLQSVCQVFSPRCGVEAAWQISR